MSEVLPDPDPERFPALTEDYLQLLDPGALFGRVHALGGPYPTAWSSFRTFGPRGARFDPHPEPPDTYPGFGVMYVSVGGGDVPPLRTCVMECFQGDATIDTKSNTPYFTLFKITAQLRLLDVSDSLWITEAGGNGAISSGPRDQARKWARAIFEHYSGQLDGIWYASSIVPAARVVALWEPGRRALPPRPEASVALAHPALQAELEEYANRRGWDLVY